VLVAYEKKVKTVKQWWATIPSISTKQTITSHLNSLFNDNYSIFSSQYKTWTNSVFMV